MRPGKLYFWDELSERELNLMRTALDMNKLKGDKNFCVIFEKGEYIILGETYNVTVKLEKDGNISSAEVEWIVENPNRGYHHYK